MIIFASSVHKTTSEERQSTILLSSLYTHKNHSFQT